VLKQRVITALILGPLVVWATLALASPWFAVVAAVVFCLGAWEWGVLAGLGKGVSVAYAAAIGAAFAGTYPWVGADGTALQAVLGVGLLWWVAALLLVMRFPGGSGIWGRSRILRLSAGILILFPSWLALVALHERAAPGFALLVMVLVSAADIGAYFAGRRFGKHKLAPRVSPGKTWEGFGGAVGITLITAAAGIWALGVAGAHAAAFAVLCVLTVAVSVLGDLVESMFKRMVGAKDSSALLPGHGGILDRIDSLTAAAPVFATGIYYLGVGV
jgi:phosphatidate cytidylyltransferase